MMVMDAVEYREQDKSFWTHFLAWQSMRARGTKKSGKGYKSAFPRFRMFYDVKKAMGQVEKSRNAEKGKQGGRFGGLGEFLRKRKEGGGDG
ncbi:MAG: hypothetical protein Q4A32_03605 [Lachnospiraceae bacterium]|nr:hypothetical protein [Lachnospiraceae bacterium]